MTALLAQPQDAAIVSLVARTGTPRPKKVALMRNAGTPIEKHEEREPVAGVQARSGISTEHLEVLMLCAESSSISSAALRMKISPSLAARKLSRLEEQLGVRLFNRTTRHLELTEAGRRALAWAQTTINGLEALSDDLAQLTSSPSGLIRFAANHFGAEHLAPQFLVEFRKSYPDIRVAVSTSDDMRDVIGDRFDVAIYSGTLPDSGLIGIRVAEYRRIVCASPEFIRSNDAPQTPADLGRLDCITHSSIEPSNWYFRFEDTLIKQVVNSVAEADNNAVLLEMARRGLGIGCLPDFMVRDDLREGRLLPLMETYEAVYSNGERPALWIVYPDRRLLNRTRLFIDFIHAAINRIAGPQSP